MTVSHTNRLITVAVIIAVLVSECAAATQVTLFNVSLYQEIEGPDTFFAATVPGVAAVMSAATPNGPFANVTAVDNTTGKILWTSDSTFDEFQNVGSEGIESIASRSVFIFRKGTGTVVIVDGHSGSVLWQNSGAKSSTQVFAVYDALGYVAVADSAGHLEIINVKNNFQQIYAADLPVPAMNPFNPFLLLTVSSQYAVLAANGLLFTIKIRGELLYSLNVSNTFSFMSSRYSIAGEVLVFNSQNNISVLTLATGEVTTITSLNNMDVSYVEVLVSPNGGTLYILSMDGDFAREKAAKCVQSSHRVVMHSCARRLLSDRRLKGGNNYPYILTANHIGTGAQVWQYFTDDTLSHLSLANFMNPRKTPLLAAVSGGGALAISASTGVVVSSVNGGSDYDENWPPLIVDGIWYFAVMYPQIPSVNFVAVEDSLL